MSDINQNTKPTLSILNQYIKDLSYENPQSINLIQSKDKSPDISINMNATLQSYDNDCIGVTFKIICNAYSEKQQLFLLELDYFGFFKIINNTGFDNDVLTNEAIRLIFPFARLIVANITQNGGYLPIILDNVDFNLTNNLK